MEVINLLLFKNLDMPRQLIQKLGIIIDKSKRKFCIQMKKNSEDRRQEERSRAGIESCFYIVTVQFIR